jgi:hypothetical protein
MGYWKKGGKWLMKDGHLIDCDHCPCRTCADCCPSDTYNFFSLDYSGIVTCGEMSIYSGSTFDMVSIDDCVDGGKTYVGQLSRDEETGICTAEDDSIACMNCNTSICTGVEGAFLDESVSFEVDVEFITGGMMKVKVICVTGLCGNPIGLFHGVATVAQCSKTVTVTNDQTCNGSGAGTWDAGPSGFGNPQVTSGGNVVITFCVDSSGNPPSGEMKTAPAKALAKKPCGHCSRSKRSEAKK